jgi:hypothetical protein
MTYDNDPNRRIDPDRPGRSRFQYRPEDGFGWVPIVLAVAAIALLIMLLLPSRDDTTGSRVTENAPTNQTTTPKSPATPPANKPAPTTPQPSQQK